MGDCFDRERDHLAAQLATEVPEVPEILKPVPEGAHMARVLDERGPICFEGRHLLMTKPVAKAILAFTSTDDSRKMLCQLRVEPHRIIASDGHTLAIVRPEPAPGESQRETYHLGRNALDRILRPASCTGLALCPGFVEPAHETFPPIGAVTPAITTKERRMGRSQVAFDPVYLARIQALSLALGAHSVCMQWPTKEFDPIRCELMMRHDRARFPATIVIMPMRGDDAVRHYLAGQ